MRTLRHEHRVGLDYLHDVTVLLQRIRRAHPSAGLYEAADFQWWWRTPRSTDDFPQLFWFDHQGRPEAAVIVTDSGRRIQLDPIVMPDATPDWFAHVVERGLAHAGEAGIEAVSLEIDGDDDTARAVLAAHGFTIEDDGVVETWLAADPRPEISPLKEGYRLASRLDTAQRPHHMISAVRNLSDPEPRLRQTSLYRPDLDLVIYDSRDRVAAYGLFWYDPETATGLVEPMRTEDEHQRRGLARHILTTGIDLLAEAGAARIKICYEPDNPASRGLYLDVGFEPDRQTVVVAGRTSGRPPTADAGTARGLRSAAMDDRDAILRSLLDERTVDIVTTGRHTGLERTTEIWTTVVDGQTYICGTPNASQAGVERRPRDWLANLVANPGFTVRLKSSVQVDLPATAERVDDPAERRRVLTAPNTEYYRDAVSLEAAIAHSPMVRVQFTGDASWLATAVRALPA